MKMKKNQFLIPYVIALLLMTQSVFGDPIPAVASYYPGGSPLVAAKILDETVPVCDNGESVLNLGRMNWNLFAFDIPGPLLNGDKSALDTNRVKVNSSVLGTYDNNHWFFFPSATPGYNLEQPFFDILAFAQAERFLAYLDNDLGADLSWLTKSIINPNTPSDDPLDGPSTNIFGVITIPNAVPGGCNNTVRWLEDGSVIPHEIGGHLLTGLTNGADPINEPLGDYWGLVMTWDSTNNPNPKVGEWIDIQFDNNGRYLRDPNQHDITYPYGLIEDESDDRRHHNNGQILTGALWSLRQRLQNQFGIDDGSKLADFLVYNLSRNAKFLFTGVQSTIITGPDSTVVLFSKVRDELVDILALLKSQADTGSYKDKYKQVDKYTIIEAFIDKGIGRFPSDNMFAGQVGLHNRGGNDTDQLYHPLYDNKVISGYMLSELDADIDGPEAWAIQTGRKEIVVSIIDTGVDFSHKEFGFDYYINGLGGLYCPTFSCNSTGNIWTNTFEFDSGIAGEDDDIDITKKGEIDDYIGWNSLYESNNPIEIKPGLVVNTHGTAVAGIVASSANEITSSGMAGVCWDCSIMAMGTGDEFGFSSTFYLDAHVDNILYSIKHNANILNLSWAEQGGFGEETYLDQETPLLFNALKKAELNNIIVVTAAGNTVQFSPKFYSTDLRPLFPQTSSLKNIINVTSLDTFDKFPTSDTDPSISSFIYGKYTVDLAAPQSYFSTTHDKTNKVYGEKYRPFSQTSSSAPVVSGALALLLAEQKDRVETALPTVYRELTLGEIRYLLLTSVDQIDNLKGITVSGGRLNAYGLLMAYKDSDMDGYTDIIENLFDTDVNNSLLYPDLSMDHDGDGVSSEDELGYGTIPILINPDDGEDLTGKIYPIYLNAEGRLLMSATIDGANPPSSGDTDGDGVSDLDEVTFGSDPANPYSVINNIIINSDIENGNLGVVPQNWTHLNYETETWADDFSRSGNHSIKFVKSNSSDLSVFSNPVIIDIPVPFSLTVGGWSKADSVILGADAQYSISIIVIYKNGQFEKIEDSKLAFQTGTHDWHKAQANITLEKEVDKVMIAVELKGDSTGTAWFDDIFIHIHN